MHPLLHRLPAEVVQIVLHHVRAMTIQRNFLRWHLYGHCRRQEWREVRRKLGNFTVCKLSRFSGVRREWRTEIACWTDIDSIMLCRILHEATVERLWGSETMRMG